MASKWIKRTIRASLNRVFLARRLSAPDAENIPVKLKDLPSEFVGYRIALVTDLHIPDCASAPAQILEALQAANPDCILLGGDLTNRYHDADTADMLAFLQQLCTVAPCYAIAGNHERTPARYAVYRELLQAANIPLLRDEFASLSKHEQALQLYGVFDPALPLPAPKDPAAILLTHYPHRAVRAKDSGFALAVCGHAHGGQVRFKKRGLFAPGQGFFAKYISGLYTVGQLQLVVSRGLGDSSLPIRLRNRPHLPLIVLEKED